MKRIQYCHFLPALLPIVMLAASCTSGTEKPAAGLTDSLHTASAGVEATPESRQITALEVLRAQVDDTSGVAFSEAFNFPVPEEVFYPYIEDAAFRAAYEKAGQKLSKELFLRHYRELAVGLELSEFRELFRQIPPAQLQHSDSLRAEKRVSKEACFRYYLMQKNGNELSIQYGSDHDQQPDSGDEDGIVCEWAAIWTFRFDGKSWRFVSVFQAG